MSELTDPPFDTRTPHVLEPKDHDLLRARFISATNELLMILRELGGISLSLFGTTQGSVYLGSEICGFNKRPAEVWDEWHAKQAADAELETMY